MQSACDQDMKNNDCSVNYDNLPPLTEGVVHVWHANWHDSIHRSECFEQFLPEHELKSARRFIRAKDAAGYVLSKAMQRMILARYLKEQPKDIQFTLGEHGKPALIEKNMLQFNLSHSGECVLLAVTKNAAIGVDVEKERPDIDVIALAKRFFANSEYRSLLSLSSNEERQHAFYRCWVRKEAFVKATGYGLSFPLSEFEVNISETCSVDGCLLRVRESAEEAKRWTLCSLAVSDFYADYHAALAVQGPVQKLISQEMKFPLPK